MGQLGAVDSATVCSDTDWQNDNCATSAQIGEIATTVKALGLTLTASGGVYRLPKTGTEAARIGITALNALSSPMHIEGVMRVRDDYGIKSIVPLIPNTATVTFLGIPLGNTAIDITQMNLTLYGKIAKNNANKGFMFNPPACGTATTNLSATAWDNQTDTGSASYTVTNCASAPFNPSLAFNPNPSPASAAAAFQVVASNPWDPFATKVGSPFRQTDIVLPQGVQLTGATNSDGSLVACSDAQFGYGTLTPSSCPAGSKVGTVSMDSPLVGVIPGDVYVAQPGGGANDLIRLFMVAQLGTQNDAVRVKLRADVSVDPATGLLTTKLTDLPAQPVKSFTFTFRAGTNPGTRQPRMCGTYPGSGALTSWSTATPLNRSANYVVSTNCPPAGKFDPTISMSSSPTAAAGFTTGTTTINLPIGDEPFKNVKVSLPAGMIANIDGISRCTLAQASADNCPAGSAVGTIRSLNGQTSVPGQFDGTIYLTDAPDSQSIVGLYMRVPVQVGPIFVDTLKIQSSLRLRTDFGIDVVSDIPATVRGLELDTQQLRLVFDRAQFLVNPPTCTGNTITGDFTSTLNTNTLTGSAVTVTGCASTAFQPSIAFSASPASAGGASALTATVTQPATTVATPQSPPKTISLALPDGVSLSPSAGSDGQLTGCSDAQFTQNDFADPTCPAGSEVGTVTIQTPSVGQLTGKAYLGTAVSGHTGRLLIDAKSDQFGTKARVKLEGLLDVDEATGKVTTVFDNIPKAGFTQFAVTLRGGTNPVLSMPRTCGTYSGSATMTPWAGSVATPTGTLNINQDCGDATSFAPTLGVTVNPTTAGRNTTLTTQIDIPQRHRELDQVTLRLPPGLIANIDGATRCTIAQATSNTCPVASRIGSAETKAGQGNVPGTFTGDIYLTDAPSAGDVVGLAIEVPAVVGPVDLGKVTALASIKLRPADYGLDVVAAVPTSQKGVPLYLQRLKLTIDKSGFLQNPSNCDSYLITSTLRSAGGSTASPSVPFQPTGCAGLGFNPTVAFSASPDQAAGAAALTTSITAPANTDASPQAA